MNGLSKLWAMNYGFCSEHENMLNDFYIYTDPKIVKIHHYIHVFHIWSEW